MSGLATNLRDTRVSYPKVGLNVVKFAKSVRVCSTRLCQKPVIVLSIKKNTGAPVYGCPVHGKRNRQQMMWLEFPTTAEFESKVEWRKVGL